jgi:hypothetical protein
MKRKASNANTLSENQSFGHIDPQRSQSLKKTRVFKEINSDIANPNKGEFTNCPKPQRKLSRDDRYTKTANSSRQFTSMDKVSLNSIVDTVSLYNKFSSVRSTSAQKYPKVDLKKGSFSQKNTISRRNTILRRKTPNKSFEIQKNYKIDFTPLFAKNKYDKSLEKNPQAFQDVLELTKHMPSWKKYLQTLKNN